MYRLNRMFMVLLAGALLAPAPTYAQAAGAVATSSSAAAQAAAPAAEEKKALTIEEYGRWRTIRSVAISDDGRWASYAYVQRRGDDTLFLRELDTARTIAIERGADAVFSDDGRWAAYFVAPPFKEVEKLERERKPVPRRAELRDLRTGEVVGEWANAGTIAFAKGSGAFVMRRPKADPRAKHEGADLIYRNLGRGVDELIGSVAQYEFNEPGTHLAYTVSSESKDGNGLYLLEVATGARRPLDGGRFEYARLTWDEDGRAVAALRGEDVDTLEQRENELVAFTGIGGRGEPAAFRFDPKAYEDFPKDSVLSQRTALTWSADLSRVFVGIKEQWWKPKERDEAPKADVDIWHWADDRLQAVQQVRANQDRNRTHLAAIELASGRLIRLADETMRTVQLTRDGRWGIGRDDRAYVHDWKPPAADYYRVDTRTGARTRLLEAHQRTLGLSPDSRNFLYWKDGHIWNYVIAADRHVNLTADAPVSFVNEEFDRFGEKPPYGVAGWTKDGRGVVLEHRYDLYLQPLDGRSASNLTGGRGAQDRIRFRYVDLDPEERFIDLSKPVLLSAFGDADKRSGFYRLERGRLTELAHDDVFYGRPTRAKNADRVLFTIERFDAFPDYHWGDVALRSVTRLTDANPQHSEYRWGRRILFDFTTAAGVELQGTLAIPDDYVEGQRLPMLVNYYEKNSQNLHRYPTPTYNHRPQFGALVSNGYLVMQPDVDYRLGPSHSQMQEAVEAAVQKVIDMGYADPARVGLHGHSYSGQGSAFIATQSSMFAAIVAGAAATNLVSDFNQLWKTSGTNQHRYDIYGQGRFAVSMFDDLELYMSQSAVYHAANMDTPLLLLHGTEDGSVEWLQAVEFYNALRFHGKPVILLSYPGEGHGLRRFENQVDFQHRFTAFLDHHLKGEPAPDWMTKGVPFIEKNRPARPPAEEAVAADKGRR